MKKKIRVKMRELNMNITFEGVELAGEQCNLGTGKGAEGLQALLAASEAPEGEE